MLKWANKKGANVNIYLKISWFYLCTKNLDDMIYSFWDRVHNELKLAILGLF